MNVGIDISIHDVSKITPEIVHFAGFDVFYLHIESPSHGNLKVAMFVGEDFYPTSPRDIPMRLLNDLGPVIEGGDHARS